MASTGPTKDGEGLWAKLRRDAMPDKNLEARPWTSAGGAKPQSSASEYARSPGGSANKSLTQAGATAPRRSANPRTSPARKPAASNSSNFDGGSAPGGNYLGGQGGKRGRNALMDEEMNEENRDDEEIPPEVLAILEEDRFVKDVRHPPTYLSALYP